MKSSFLVTIKEKLVSFSKKPWACFETDGLSDSGLGIAIHWNKAFIEHLHSKGISGMNDEETIQLFFLFMSAKIGEGMIDPDDNSVNPEATPNLTSEANKLIS